MKIRDCGQDERYFCHIEFELDGRMVLISYKEWDRNDMKRARLLAIRLSKFYRIMNEDGR